MVWPELPRPQEIEDQATNLQSEPVRKPKSYQSKPYLPSQLIAAHLSGSRVQVFDAPVLGLRRFLEVLDGLIFEQAISQDHGQMEDAAQRTQLLALLDQLTRLFCIVDVQIGYHDRGTEAAPMKQASSLIAGANAASAGEDNSERTLGS